MSLQRNFVPPIGLAGCDKLILLPILITKVGPVVGNTPFGKEGNFFLN